MKINRKFTKAGVDVFSTTEWEKRTSKISHTDGSVVFEMKDAEIPGDWSQLATDIVVSKYFRKAGVPQVDANGAAVVGEDGKVKTGPEKSVKQVVHRLAGCWTKWGKDYGYFNSDEDAQAFYDELAFMLIHQIAAPNSPQWFNTGLHYAYGLTGPSQGHWHVNPASGQLEQTKDAYTNPQPHACQPYFAPVSTPQGPVKIGQIVEQNQTGLEVFDGSMDGHGTTHITAVKENGKKLVYRLQLASGTAVYATKDHRVLCVPFDDATETEQWREIGDLRSGDRLFQRVSVTNPRKSGELVQLARSAVEMIEHGTSNPIRLEARKEIDCFMQLVEVDNVSEVGIEMVYDIQTKSGRYLSNGVIVHNCFIQGVEDDLVNEGGIMDLWTREARLFKYGSGTGTNFSQVRGENENLSGGGKSSGLMSFLKIGDRAAGAIKSGGTTRRAAKMVCLELDHPDIEEFINWKVREEIKVACLVEGIKHLPKEQQELAKKMKLKLDFDFNGEAYATVSGQNSNNSVRVSNKFLKAVEENGEWQTIKRTNGKVHKTLKARDLWEQIGYAAWRCADPGVQYDDTINEWHTCPQSGRINASNPCVTGDTLVATSEGFRRIVDLVGKSAEIINGNGDAVFVDQIFKTGTKDVYQLRTRSGYGLKLTADHKIKTANRGDVPACELTLDDMVMLEKPGFGDAFVPEAFGELVGAALGDGCVTQGTAGQEFLFISLSSDEAILANRLQENINESKRWLNEGDGRGIRATDVSETATGLRVGTSVNKLITQARQFALLDCGSENKAFTDGVFALDRRSIAAMLRGLFTTDGTVANYGEKSQYVSLDSTSLKLLEQTQMLLLGFGIKAKIYRNRRALDQTSAIMPDGKGGQREYPVQQMHSLRISRGSRIIFEKEIGFIVGTAKEARLAELNRTVGAYKDSMTDAVASLTHCGVEDVYDLSEPVSHHFVANGIVVHNCSEYMFLDNTACNLASVNLMKLFNNKTREFDIEGFKHACRLWTVVLEISVLMASYPSREIARLSYEYRTLGLGYANIGTMLMVSGIAYDSDVGRAVCGAVSAVMTGESYATSAEMAKEHGAFPGYRKNRNDMLRVMRNHRAAAYNNEGDYEGLTVKPVAIDAGKFNGKQPNSIGLLHAARECWDRALALGEQYGYRNAQTTVIAPTGTIGLLMDCDTTGVEPDFALVKFKKLAGGGYFKIANQSVEPALLAMGYSEKQVKEILTYVMGTLTLKGAPHINQEVLRAKGFTDEELAKTEACLPSVFELAFAFSPWTLGEEFMQRLGIPREQWQNPSFNLLRTLGFSKKHIQAANEFICGTQTIEGASHLREEHYAVFDCANRCGRKGKRFIQYMGHVRMMAAAQPFISGAISKTINMPNEVSVADIEVAYMESWKMSLKAVALYRDGSKLSQPLNTSSDDDTADDRDVDDLKAESQAACHACGDPGVAVEKSEIRNPKSEIRKNEGAAERMPGPVEKVIVKIVERPLRRRLPDTRASVTHKFDIAGHEGYITVGLFEDNTPGEVFITMAKQGSTIGGLMDTIATLISLNFQYGVPMDAIVRKFEHMRFEPAGMTTNQDIPFAKSFIDYVVRWMGMQFIPGYRAANAPKRESQMNTIETATAIGPDVRSENLLENGQGSGGAETLGQEAGREVAAGQGGPSYSVGNGHGNHGGNGKGSGTATLSVSRTDLMMQAPATAADTLSQAMSKLMGDAPTCTCGSITVRNGSCYKCLNCGASLGCS